MARELQKTYEKRISLSSLAKGQLVVGEELVMCTFLKLPTKCAVP